MSRHPIPPHGSETRYKGTRSGSWAPCRCTPCTRANRLAGIRRARARAAGEALLISRDVLLPHIQECQASGMSQALIGRQAHVSQTTISYLINGKIQSCQRDKALGILAGQPGHFDDLAERPALGASRRTRALYAIGHGRDGISAVSGLSPCTIGQIANSRYTLIDGRIDAAIRLAYRTLSPTQGASLKARHRAETQNWAPPAAWDDDTLDDPNAHPDWTGHCGTDRGWWMHSNNGIPTCARCETAHAAWLADRKHLPSGERFRQLALAKGAASNRGATIAADARELMRVSGLNYEQLAERLGVTTNHIQQELLRHPETLEVAA